ncbi:MAG: helix-turn-helix transcriptional regulator [Clostridia bacterium]|nr:helix-turn-helix transcriptional regulator [Clostridia bacterium]
MEIQAIKTHLKSNKITYEQLSEKSGIPLNTLKNIFSGRTPNPRVDTMQAIEAALELNTSPLQWTDEEKAAGVGAHGIKLSNEEWDWLELRSAIIEAKGEKGLRAIQIIIQTYLDEK